MARKLRMESEDGVYHVLKPFPRLAERVEVFEFPLIQCVFLRT